MQPAVTLFVIMVVLFAAGVCLLFASYMKDEILTPIKSKFTGSEAKGVIANVEYAFNIFDQLFFFAAIGLGLVSVLLAYITPARPAFLFLSIILFAISLLIVPSFSNIFIKISERSQFTTYTTDYPITMHIFQNYGLFFWVFGFLILIVLYAKLRGGGEYAI